MKFLIVLKDIVNGCGVVLLFKVSDMMFVEVFIENVVGVIVVLVMLV